ncbi:MAG: deoxyguanosinetriphosphate triphosphohydrolase [Gammaproteobacteria bacterium]
MAALANYAAREETSRGRLHKEAESKYRNLYQRDRDRIIHSAAFRRLEYKTQVFVNHEGDMFRTRLTHSIEVAQIGRTIARALRLNEDLTEAICLAHDLGHTPFGHAGQDVLNKCMSDFGGFEHNLQSLRVVDLLEEKYANFPGLNLTYETREGILKHCSHSRAIELDMLGQRFIEGWQPGLEAQIVNIADEIAYNNHDVDDGLRAGLIDVKQLCMCSLFCEHFEHVNKAWPDLEPRRVRHEIIRRIINTLVSDLIVTSKRNIALSAPEDIDSVRKAGKPLIAMSESVCTRNIELKGFLRSHLYQHKRVMEMTHKTKQIIRTLFNEYMSTIDLLPEDVQNSVTDLDKSQRARIITDYIAGMTDRFAFSEYERISEPRDHTTSNIN